MNHKYPNPKKNGKYLFFQWIRSHPQEHPTHITLLESLCRRHMQEINQEIGPMMFLMSVIMIMVMLLMEERIQECGLITCGT